MADVSLLAKIHTPGFFRLASSHVPLAKIGAYRRFINKRGNSVNAHSATRFTARRMRVDVGVFGDYVACKHG